MIGETSERTNETNPNSNLETSLEGDEEEDDDDDDGPTIVLGNGSVEPPSVGAGNKLELGDSQVNKTSPVETDAGNAGEDVKDEKDDVEIVEKEVIMETPVTETGIAETKISEPRKEVEIPVAETVVPEVKTEVDIPVAETGVAELKTEESENVQN